MGKPQTIIEYEISEVQRRWYNAACRYALGTVIRDPQAIEPAEGRSGNTAVRASTLHLMRQWRARVAELRKKGWAKVDGSGWYFASNCPPVGVRTSPSQKPCRLQQICPFCWCRRYVLETCNRLRWFYYGTTDDREFKLCEVTKEETRIPARSVDLLEVITTLEWPVGEISLAQLFSDVSGQDEYGRYGRDRYIKRMKAAGAFQLFSIEPPDPRQDKPVWRWQQRVLALMLPGDEFEIRDIECPEGASYARRTGKRLKDIHRRVLAGAVGRTCSYPSQLLRGSVEDTVDILQYINGYRAADTPGTRSRGFRMASYYGALRNKQAMLLEARLGKRE